MNKTTMISLLLMAVTLTANAQTNPQPGYIITNNGDTIRGIIDFRTNEKLSKQCLFRANGDSEGKTYKPGDIEGFRFVDNGKYFVTRRLNVYGEPELFFAEFMVQGKMNLYCVASDYDEYFFFEREDGEMAQLTNRALISASSLQDEKENLQQKKEQVGRVKLLLQDSWKAANGMNKMDMTRKQLVDVVRDYHRDVCTDGSSCMVYEYKPESDKVKIHFKAFASYAYYSHEKTDKQDIDENYSGSAFDFGLGVEIDIERVMKGGSLELGISYSPKAKFEHDVLVSGGHEPSHTVYEKGRVVYAVGMVKRFGSGKILPLVRGGGFYVQNFGNKETRYYMNNTYEWEWDNTKHYGLYLGAGAQMPVGKHAVRLHADLYKSLESTSIGNMTKWGLTAEFVL